MFAYIDIVLLISSIMAIAEIKSVPGIDIDLLLTVYSLFRLSLPEIKGMPKLKAVS